MFRRSKVSESIERYNTMSNISTHIDVYIHNKLQNELRQELTVVANP